MTSFVRYIVSNTYKPLLVKYLSRNRLYASNGIGLEIPPEVFHPGFFFSTKLLMRCINNLELKGRTLLELGAGSGFIAMNAERRGAIVTATDINPVAIEYLEKNRLRNGSSIRIVHSDLFDAISLEAFDIIAINPPYYKKDPHAPAEHAWFCGSKGQYFERLFMDLGNYMHAGTEVLMVLCDGCDLAMINSMAMAKGFKLVCIRQTRNLIERNYVFKIEKV